MHDQQTKPMDQTTEYPTNAVCYRACWGEWFWFVPSPRVNETRADAISRCAKSTNAGIHAVTVYGYPGELIAK